MISSRVVLVSKVTVKPYIVCNSSATAVASFTAVFSGLISV